MRGPKISLAIVVFLISSAAPAICRGETRAEDAAARRGQRAAAGTTADPPSAQPSVEKQRDLSRLLSQFRRARGDPSKQAQHIEEAIAYGPPAVWAVLELIGREIDPPLQRYRNLFYQQTAASSKERISRADPAEIVRLRAAVLGLSKEPNFSKETIVARGDPAIRRLEEAFLVGRAEVLQRSKKLRTEREKLQPLGALWQRCAVYLYETLPDDENKPSQPPSFEQYLQGEEELATLLALPMDPLTRAVMAANARIASGLDPEESRAILALNLMRNLLGLQPLVIEPKLAAAARDHSQDMQRLKFFSHQSPVPGKESPWDRAKRFGTTASGENIFMGSHDGRVANLSWFHSPEHHKNMLANHRRVGVGRAGAYFTQMFGQ